MRFAIALNLRDFIDRLPALTARGVVGGERRTTDGGVGKQHAVREVAVVRNRHYPAAGALLVVGEVVPELLRVG